MSEIEVRPLRVADVPAVLALQAQCYEPQFLESAQAFEAKLQAAQSHGTCWIASAADGRALAYVVSLPACPDSLPALDAQAIEVPEQPQLLYLHDLAVAPAGRSLGLARRLVQLIEARALKLGLRHLGLIAVQGSTAFWQRQGFAALNPMPRVLAPKLASFGVEACFMQRALG